MIKNIIKAYIAGLIDGEGSVTIAKRKNGHYKEGKGKAWYYQPIVNIANTDKRMLDFVVSHYKGWITEPKPQKSHYKQAYLWFISGEAMKFFLKDILPYLVIKRQQAEIVLSFPNYQHRGFGWGRTAIGRSQKEIKRQDDLWEEIVKLNH